MRALGLGAAIALVLAVAVLGYALALPLLGSDIADGIAAVLGRN